MSRVLGMIRDMVIAGMFGASAVSDAFFLAFRLPDFSRKLLSEGVISISWVPIFSKALVTEGQSGAARMASSLFFILAVIIPGVSILLVWAAPFLFDPFFAEAVFPLSVPSLFGPAGGPDHHQLTVLLFRIMVPYMGALGFLAACMAVLHALGRFALPAAGPVLFNLTVIGCAVGISGRVTHPIVVIAAGVSIGGMVQLCFQIPALVSAGMIRFSRISITRSGVRQFFTVLLPGMIGTAGYQINLLIGSFWVFSAGSGSVSFLYYADRLVQFCAGVVTVSVSTVLLPDLSRQAAGNRDTRSDELVAAGLAGVLFAVMPAMAGMAALRHQIVALLFGRGAFDQAAVAQTADVILFLILGMWAFSGTRLLVTLFQARSDLRHPLRAALISTAVHVGLSAVLYPRYQLSGIAISLAVGSMVQFFILALRAVGVFRHGYRVYGWFVLKTAGASLVMYQAVNAIAALIFEHECGNTVLIGGTAGCIIAGAVIYSGIHLLVSRPELAGFLKNRHMPS